MKNAYTAVIKQDDGWWIGWIEEIPGVNCQERTKEELLESLRITLKEALEFNCNDSKGLGGKKAREREGQLVDGYDADLALANRTHTWPLGLMPN
jgi:predicted RNase H-like HicB family nuclease